MEILEDKIKTFFAIDYDIGKGYGFAKGCGKERGNGRINGNGYGNGCGYVDDNSYANGYSGDSGKGCGNGEGFGCGYYDGIGFGISEINGYKVHNVDDTPTIITNIRGNFAKGYTIGLNTMLVPCYIAKVGVYFAHGETIQEAMQAATEKYAVNRPLIADVIKKYPTLDTVVPHKELYRLHSVLTGSCKFGRDEFAKAHNLDPNKGEMTMREFIELTKSAYGGDIIWQLEQTYKSA